MISYVIPTRDRPERLALTLAALGRLAGHPESARGPLAEVVIVDNASQHPPTPPARLANGLRVRTIYRCTNEGAASRNAAVAAADPASEWVVMLDDDSHPVDTGFISRLARAPEDVAAVSADIWLPGLARRESGGLPEVFVGCGVAIRRRVFLDLGGYDPEFNYYAEEYDLAARMILRGYRVEFDPWFRVEHHKVTLHRNQNTILARLVRNNGWVMQRYAPERVRRAQIREQRRRYRAIARVEHALDGFAEGLRELRRTISAQPRTPMSAEQFDRFCGLAQAREALAEARHERPFSTAAVVDEGKNGWVVRTALTEMGVEVVNPWPWDESPARAQSETHPDALVIGTMSPGPMIDAYERRTLARAGTQSPRVIAPWRVVSHGRGLSVDALVGGPVGASSAKVL
ncbi:MAG: glycosyltransferase [Phycisphaerae bacterium]|nr:glycosyltransferase [Phycisphaerae bacterium]